LEIKDYVGALAGRGRIVVAVAIVAGFLAVVVYVLQPQRYKATATVVLPSPPSTTTSLIAAISEAYADFSGALTTDVVAERAATDAGVTASMVKGHLSVSRLSNGSVAQVTYTGPDKEHADEIAKAASQEALGVVISARLDPLDQQLELAQTAYDDANTLLQQFAQETGIVSSSYFDDQQKRVQALMDELGAATPGTQEATNLEAKIAEKNTKLSQELARFQPLTSARETALESLQTAQQAELTEKGLLQSVEQGGGVSVSIPSSAPRLAGLIKAVVPAVVVATGLAIALIVLLEVVGPVRLPSRGRADDGPGLPDEAEEAEDSGPEAQEQEQDALEPDDDLDEPERDPAGRRIRTRA
jgi:capsular polysaccharide biosynthesis protein